MSSRIEQIIEEIEEYVDSCKFQPLSSTKIVVNKEELEELLRELRMKTPDEIKRYQKIISNKDAILADAQSKADAIIADAKTQAQQMVTESEVMQQAYAQSNELLENTNQQAQEIMDNATTDANNIRMGALQYTEETNDNQMIHHFYNRGEDAPLWVVFEILYLSDLASFFECLNENMREHIMNQLDIFDLSIDSNRNLLSGMLYTLKNFA